MSRDTIEQISDRRVKLDDLVRDYVRQRLSYRYVETPDGGVARTLEAQVRRGALRAGLPVLNPL